MGPVYVPHLKLSFGGTIGQPEVEQWSNTVRFDTGGFDVPEGNIDAALGAIRPIVETWFRSPDTSISAVARLKWLKLNWILANGRQRSVNTHQVDTLANGGEGGAVHWYQTLALTMRTDLQRGRGHAGRIFPPVVVAFPEGNSPYIAAVKADKMAASWAATLSALATSLGSNLGGGEGTFVGVWPVVASPGESDPTSFQGPLMNRITRVVVDRVGDVQHRRTAQIPRLEGAGADVTGTDI